jgi:ubiquinone/menaquinone biosynthesis C-methylase UbiE
MEGNGYIFDPNDPMELARLQTLDSAFTRSMGLLTGVPDDFEMHNVLDLACGPGGWVLDVAFEYPDVEVAGVDISRKMVNYANARALSQQRTNASFEQMDIRQPLEFADGAFDLVNARFLVGVLQREQWFPLMKECSRLLRPGGVIRLAESDGLVVCNSPSLARLQRQLLLAMTQKGYGFSVDGYTLGITPVLPHLLRQAGFQSITSIPFLFDLSQSSPSYVEGLHMSEIAYREAERHHLLEDIPLTEGESLEMVIQQMLVEMQQTSFCGVTYGATVCGTKISH